MKKEVRQLREKAINALVLSIDHFNRPWDRGRAEAVLILLDHSFEMLLKSAIRQKGGKIRKAREKQTIGFDACVRKGLTDANLKFLTDEQALTLQTINGQRDAAQHYLVDMSEHQLYFYAQAGVTLFRDLHDDIFDEKLLLQLPERVLPISTTAPKDLAALFDKEIEEIKGLLVPGTRKRMDAVAKARSLAVLESTVNGDYEQPSDRELEKVCKRLADGEAWSSIFPGVASINISAEGDGPTLSLRLTKKEGTPVQLLKEGEGAGAVIAVRRVNELGYYSMGLDNLAKNLGINRYRTQALVYYFKLQNNEEYFKEIRIGSQIHKRYSQKALEKIRNELPACDMNVVINAYKNR